MKNAGSDMNHGDVVSKVRCMAARLGAGLMLAALGGCVLHPPLTNFKVWLAHASYSIMDHSIYEYLPARLAESFCFIVKDIEIPHAGIEEHNCIFVIDGVIVSSGEHYRSTEYRNVQTEYSVRAVFHPMRGEIRRIAPHWTVTQVHELAEHGASWLRPRWLKRVRLWRQMLVAAAEDDVANLERSRMQGLQMLAAEAWDADQSRRRMYPAAAGGGRWR